MNTKLIIIFTLVNLIFAQYGPEFDGAALQPPDGEEYAAQQDFEGENAEVPFESTQEGAFESLQGGEYGGPQDAIQPGMIPNDQMQPGPYGGFNPEETMHRSKLISFRK